MREARFKQAAWWLGKESYNQQNRRDKQQRRAEALRPQSPAGRAHGQIQAERRVHRARQHDVEVPRAQHHSYAVADGAHIRVDAAQVLPGEDEGNERQHAHNQV